MTEEPDAETPQEDEEVEAKQSRGFLSFLRRRESENARSETEWVDTLVAQPDADEEPTEDVSPFQLGAEPALAEPEPEPEPEVEDPYVMERQWRRRQHDELDRIHNYIDRIIGSDHDPVIRHRKLAGLGVARHTAPRRDLASVDVEGLDQELMIAFTFPKEELRSARVVYETEGGYVIEVLRAVGGDDARTERQYYTVSRVGSVAHTLDKLRAREIERRVRSEEDRRTAPRSTSRAAPEGSPWSAAPREPPADEAGEEPDTQASASPVVPTHEPHAEPAMEAPQAEEAATEEPPAATPDAEHEAPTGPMEEHEATERRGFRMPFRRREKDEAPVPEPAPEASTEDEDATGEGAAKKGGITRFLRRDKSDDADAAPEAGAEAEAPAAESPDESTDEANGKRGAFSAISARFRRGKDEPKDDDESPTSA